MNIVTIACMAQQNDCASYFYHHCYRMPEINHFKAEPLYLDSWFQRTSLGLHGNVCFHGNHGSRICDMEVPVPPNRLKTSKKHSL